jgi:hypothetical protein
MDEIDQIDLDFGSDNNSDHKNNKSCELLPDITRKVVVVTLFAPDDNEFGSSSDESEQNDDFGSSS